MKLRHERTDSGIKGKFPAGPANFAKAAALIAGLASAGCGDTIYNYYNTGADGGARPDMQKSDSRISDLSGGEFCQPSNIPITCSDKPVVAGVLNQGESLSFSNYKLQLDDIQVVGTEKPAAAVSLIESTCGFILIKTKISEGQTKAIGLGGVNLELTAEEIMPGYTFGAKWANFTLRAPCQDMTQYWCPAVSGVINQGESILVDNLKFQLDDLEVKGIANAAIISVIDANGSILKKDKIAEGSSVEMVFNGKSYLVSVKKVASGYSFGAKWAEIEISGKAQNPCGS